MIKEITDKEQKKAIAREILEALHDWFEVDESREQYIAESADEPFFAAIENDKPVGFLCLKQTGKRKLKISCYGYCLQGHYCFN